MADTPKMTPEEATEKLRNLEWSSKNYAQIRQYLTAGADVNVQKEDGRSLLFVACIHFDNESEKLVKELLQAGADPNIQNKRGDSSVYAMALMSNFKKLKALAEYGADFLDYEELLLTKFKRNPEAIAFINETIRKQKKAKRDAFLISKGKKPLGIFSEIEQELYDHIGQAKKKTRQPSEEPKTTATNEKQAETVEKVSNTEVPLRRGPGFEINWEQGPDMSFKMTHILKGSFEPYLRPYYFNSQYLTQEEQKQALKMLAYQGIIPQNGVAPKNMNSGVNVIKKGDSVWVVGAEYNDEGKEISLEKRKAQINRLKAFWKIGEDDFTTALCMGLWHHKQHSM